MKNINDFAYWLSGALEYVNPKTLTLEQAQNLVQGIKDHLALITVKATPDPISEPQPKRTDPVTPEPVTSPQTPWDVPKMPEPWPYVPKYPGPFDWDRIRFKPEEWDYYRTVPPIVPSWSPGYFPVDPYLRGTVVC